MRALSVLALAGFASSASIRIADPLLPQVAHDFAIASGEAAMMVTAFGLGYGGFQIVYGPIGDRYGKYQTVAIICVLAALGSYACAIVNDLWGLSVARFISGAVSAAIVPMAFAWIGDVIPFHRRQPIFARYLSGQIMGQIAGQAVGGVLGEWLGWRQVFVVLAVIHLIAAAAMFLELKLSPATRSASVGQARGLMEALHLYPSILARRQARMVLSIITIEGALMFGAVAFVGADLHARLGASFSVVGLSLMAFGAGGLIYTLNAPFLFKLLGERGLASIGGAILGAGYVVLALSPSLAVAVPAIVAMGLGFFMMHNTLQTQATQMAPEARGTALSIFGFCFFTGQACGVALAGWIVDRYGGPPLFVGVGISLMILGLAFSRRLGRR